jgi:hypothetical protein
MRLALLPPGYKDRKGELIPIVDFCFEILKRRGIPPVDEDDASFLQGKILLEKMSPWALVVCLECDEHIPQGGGFKVQRDGSLQNKFSSEYVCDDGHDQKESSSEF